MSQNVVSSVGFCTSRNENVLQLFTNYCQYEFFFAYIHYNEDLMSHRHIEHIGLSAVYVIYNLLTRPCAHMVM